MSCGLRCSICLAVLKLLAMVGTSARCDEPAATGPVQDFRQVLHSSANGTARREALKKLADALKNPADLYEAIRLPDWRDGNQQDAEPDQALCRELTGRLEELLREYLQHGTPKNRIAAASLLGAATVNLRWSQNEVFGQGLASDLAEIIGSANEASVRQSAARALARILPDPQVAVPALNKLLGSSVVDDRRAAANALCDVIRVASLPEANVYEPEKLEAIRARVITAGCQALQGTAAGLQDKDPEVRSRCIEAARETALVLTAQVPSADQIRYHVANLSNELNRQLQSLSGALAEAIKNVGPQMGDTDALVCTAGAAAVEAAAEAANKFSEQHGDVVALRKALRGVVPDLAKLLARGEVRLKLAALYALESLGPDAGPAVETLVAALQDRDSFVRWGAARALAKMAPAENAKAVAGLVSAIKDPNGDVRAAVLVALGRFGPSAGPAVGPLTEALKGSEVETRILAAGALEAIGKEAAPSVPALVDALTSPEGKLRVASARALGRIGSGPGAAEVPLQTALNDADDDVRLAASEALLLIGQKK
jgi:HEAT repeat protein